MSLDPPRFRRPELPPAERADDLLARMTLEEKIDQLHQGSIGDTNLNNLGERAAEFRPTYGSYILGGPAMLEVRNAVQRRAVEQSRLGIPVLFGADVIHGYRVILPIPLAQACTWNPALVQRGAALAAREARAQGIDWTFAPMVDHCIDPRWGRIAETFGESPHASSVYAAAAVRGYQGTRLDAPDALAACLKHFVGYGASEGGRDYSATDLSDQTLWESHLPAFESGVRAGARTVMSGFNDLNGVPTSANRFTLTEILRERWGFEGLVVSDWNAVLQLTHQGFASSGADAAHKAIEAGVDLDMADGLYAQHLAALVNAGSLSVASVDAAARRVLRLKFELGLFERPYTERSDLTDAAPTRAELAVAEELAAQSIVLLKNDGVLPLCGGGRSLAGTAHGVGIVEGPGPKRVALLGPLAENSGALLGSWAQQGRPDETPSLADALREWLPAAVILDVQPISTVEGAGAHIDAAVAAARVADIVILCLGEEASMSGENASRSTLRLAGRQEELALAVARVGKPIVLVLVSGRPLDISAIESSVQAVIAAWQGGSRAAAAVSDVLCGYRNPSGRLGVTWPRSTGQIPLAHNQRPRARLGDEGAYRDTPTAPLYAFGHGLSFTAFAYSPIRLDREEVTTDGRLVAEVTVSNTGSRDGEETVLWFMRDPVASVTRPLKELKHFEKAAIPAGGSRVFRFEIDPARDLSFPDSNGRAILEPGEIVLMAGSVSARFNVMRS